MQVCVPVPWLQVLKAFFMEYNIHIQFLPVYSPFLNPVETMFSKIRTLVSVVTWRIYFMLRFDSQSTVLTFVATPLCVYCFAGQPEAAGD